MTGQVDESIGDGVYNMPARSTDTVCLGSGDEKTIGEGHAITRYEPKPCEDQVGATIIMPVIRMAYVARTCVHNLHNALCNRHLLAPPPIVAELKHAREMLCAARRELEYLYPAVRQSLDDSWLDRWPMAKRAAIAASVAVDAIMANRLKAMVKREVAHAPLKKARAIQFYVNLATQERFARDFAALQKTCTQVFYRWLAPGGIRLTIASGMNATQLGRWYEEVLSDYSGDVSFIERDGKAWDSTMQGAHFALKHIVYEIAGPEFQSFVRQGAVCRGYSHGNGGFISYRVTDTVKSGHNDTTLGNNIVNLAITYEAMRRLGLRGDVIVAGDDMLSIVAGRVNRDDVATEEAKYGIRPEARVFLNSPWSCSFVSGAFLRLRCGWVFVPRIGRLLARLGWTVNPPAEKNLAAYRRGIVLGLKPVLWDMPFIRVLIRRYDNGGRVLKTDRDYLYRDAVLVPYEPGEAEEYVKLRYDLTSDDILEGERVLTEAPDLCYIRHPVFERLAAVDLADVDDRAENHLQGAW